MGAVANFLARIRRRARPTAEPCWLCVADDQLALRLGLMCATHRARVRDIAFGQGTLSAPLERSR